jgi:hypothetical protein
MQNIDLHEKLILAHTTLSEGNMDDRFSDRSVIMANRRKFLNQFNLNPKLTIEGKQVHDKRILVLNSENTKMWYGVNIPGVDGFVTDQKDVGILLKVADCVPVIVYDPTHHVFGAFHVGWQGAVKNIHTLGLTSLTAAYQTDPNDVLVWLGPSAHKCHYVSAEKPEQIDEEVWKSYISPIDTGWQVDLIGYLTESLIKAGVGKKNITIDPRCTVETPELFSHTRSKNGTEAEGRILVLAQLR